jgi:hypothetical protein
VHVLRRGCYEATPQGEHAHAPDPIHPQLASLSHLASRLKSAPGRGWPSTGDFVGSSDVVWSRQVDELGGDANVKAARKVLVVKLNQLLDRCPQPKHRITNHDFKIPNLVELR